MTLAMTVTGPGCCCEHYAGGYGIRGYGNSEAEVMLVGIAPGRQEVKAGRPFVGPSGERNDKILKAAGYRRDLCYVTNLICWWKDDPTEEEIAECWPRLAQEIATVRPRLIVALGGLATEWLTGRKIGKTRGAIIRPEDNLSTHMEEYGLRHTCVLPTWHPAFSLRMAPQATDILRDFRKIPRFLAGELDPPTWRREIVQFPVQAQEILRWLNGRRAALDVETTFDNEDTFGEIVCLAIAARDGADSIVAHVFPREVLEGAVWPPLVDWGYHNGPFDVQAVRRTFGVKLPIRWDSMMESVARDERPGYERDDAAKSAGRNKPLGPGYHGLKQLQREYCGGRFYEEKVKDKLGHEWHEYQPAPGAEVCGTCGLAADDHLTLDEFYTYNALDAVNTLVLPDRLPSKGVAARYRDTMLIPASNAFAEIQYGGIAVNRVRLDELMVHWADETFRLARSLETTAAEAGFHNPVKRRRQEELTPSPKTGKMIHALEEYEEPFNPESGDQLARLLYSSPAAGGLGLRTRMRTKGGKRLSTSQDTLEELDHPFVTTMLRHKKYARAVMNLEVIRKHIRPDGKVHPTALPLATGRYAWVDPAMQTLAQPYTYEAAGFPELAVLRSVIEPSSPDMILCEVDYSQVELWAAALLSGDQQMLEDLQTPEGVHTRVTRETLGCHEPESSPIFKARRRDAKVVTFAILFKEGAKKLASKQVGINCSVPEAERHIRNWYKRYPRIRRYQDEQIRKARTQGKIETPFGFIRRFPLYDPSMDNQIVNVEVQSTAYGHTHVSMVALVDPDLLPPPEACQGIDWAEPFKRVRPLGDLGGRVLLTVHDSILFELPRRRVGECLDTIKAVMEAPKLPGWPGMRADPKLGDNWHDMHEWERRNGVWGAKE